VPPVGSVYLVPPVLVPPVNGPKLRAVGAARKRKVRSKRQRRCKNKLFSSECRQMYDSPETRIKSLEEQLALLTLVVEALIEEVETIHGVLT